MSSALNKPKYKMIIDNYYNQIANKEESLTSLNTALLLKGL
jgi:Fe-S cluster assembly protein SufD